MNLPKRPLFALLTTLLLGCTSSNKLEGFRAEDWETDKMGCLGKRKALRTDFEKVRLQLRGLTQDEVLATLGKPDFQRLYQRNQKFYVYFMEPGIQCQGQADSSRARTVVLRLSALGIVTEVFYETGKPR